MVYKARSDIILCLEDKVLRKIAKDKNANSVWEKIDLLHVINYLTHILCLKIELYSFWILENKFIVEQLINYHTIMDDLININVKIDDDDDKALLLLSSLSKSSEHFG